MMPALKSTELSMPQQKELQEGFATAFQLVDDVVLKNYITKLTEMSVIPLDNAQVENSLGQIRLFKINKMFYEKVEPATYKFASVFNAVAATESAIVAVIDSDGTKTDFYLGIRSLNKENSTNTCAVTLQKALEGQFPGIEMENRDVEEIEPLLKSFSSDSISVVSCVANNKNEDLIANNEYLQGLEKLALAMQGSRYTAVIIANSTSQEQLNQVRQGYESIYTQLSPYAKATVNYGTNNSTTKTDTETDGTSKSAANSTNHTDNHSNSRSENIGEVVNESQKSLGGKVGSVIGTALTAASAVIGSVIPGAGTAAGAVIGGAIGSVIGSAVTMATDRTISRTHGGGAVSETNGTADTIGVTETSGTSHSLARASGISAGETQSLQLEIQNKPLQSMLDRIDKQLERLSDFESVGMWESAAYFMSSDSSVSKVAAATYKALMSGENSGLEVSAINTWNKPQVLVNEGVPQCDGIAEYIRNFIHPKFSYQINGQTIPVAATNLVSGNELAIHMGLPRHSVCGFPVIEHIDFGKDVVKYDSMQSENTVKLGDIFSMGRVIDKANVKLDIESLAMHTFVTGATGSGKSNTVYTLLNRLTTTRDDLHFMVIEPAKGEYKRIFGHKKGVSVFGSNPAYTKLLKINPFKFSKNIHVLEHVDRLIEIFNVCWPMYAAMPAVLKDAVLAAYSSCGWNLTTSKNLISDTLFPTFQDLLEQLVRVINESGYSEEVKSNYVGSLTTRVRSLTNGLNGQIFSSKELDNHTLFDTNVIVDLSRIGSQETKALIMGVLVMRLSEYRMGHASESNSKLHHITILEEAHNILGANSDNSDPESSNIAGKSVEMLSNAIAEMRTYGEGFIIADQSPGAVDISAIRNTNTKIIMRLPEECDRRMAGKSAALKDEQIDEIARLPKGVAVVYQNDWLEPVLCKIDKFSGKEKYFVEKELSTENTEDEKAAHSILVNFIAQKRLDYPDKIDAVEVSNAIEDCNCTVRTKASLYALLREFKMTGKINIWSDKKFSVQAQLITDILGLQDAVDSAKKVAFNDVGFTCYLNTMIAQKVKSVSDELLLTLSHYLVKAYSEKSGDGLEFYKEWVESFNGKEHIL